MLPWQFTSAAPTGEDLKTYAVFFQKVGRRGKIQETFHLTNAGHSQ